MRTRAGVAIRMGLLAGLLLATPPLAGAHGGDPGVVHLCVQDVTGEVRLVGPNDPCRPRETAIDWNPSPPAPAPAPTPAATGPTPLVVVDAAGAVVGPVVSLSGTFPIVGVRAGGAAFTLGVYDQGFFAPDYVFFTNGDCTGSAYLMRSPALGLFPTAAVDQLGRVYADDGASQPASVTVSGAANAAGCAGFPAMTVELVPATLVFDQGAFHLPFSVH